MFERISASIACCAAFPTLGALGLTALPDDPDWGSFAGRFVALSAMGIAVLLQSAAVMAFLGIFAAFAYPKAAEGDDQDMEQPS